MNSSCQGATDKPDYSPKEYWSRIVTFSRAIQHAFAVLFQPMRNKLLTFWLAVKLFFRVNYSMLRRLPGQNSAMVFVLTYNPETGEHSYDTFGYSEVLSSHSQDKIAEFFTGSNE